MPRNVSELPETRESIARPVAFDITREIGEILRLPTVTEILFMGVTDQAQQSGSSLNYTGAPTKFPGGTRITVNMSEGSDENAVFAENSLQENAPIVFLDRGLGVRMRPVYSSTVMTLSFEVRSRSRVEAEKVRDEFRVRAAMGRQQLLHQLTYHFGIPAEHMELLTTIHTQREAVAGYGDTFEAWLRAHATSRLTQVSTLVGTNAAWVFGEVQVGVQGGFDFNVQPEAPDKSGDTGEYVYPIEYKVRYDKVVAMSLDYQLVNHNQLLPAKYHGPVIAGGITPDPYAQPVYSDYANATFRALFLNKRLLPSPIDGVRSPVFDDWMPAAVASDTSTVYVTMIAVNPEDLNEVIDLTQLDGVVIDGDIRAYMATQGAKLGKQYQCAIHVGLYKGQHWLGDEAITVSPDLKVRSTQPLCLRDRYHLRVAVLNDLLRLTDTARFDLRSQGVACQKLLLTLQQNLRDGQYVPILQGGKYVPDALLIACAKRINAGKESHFTGLECRMLTVGNFLISTKRMAEYAAIQPNPTERGDDPASDPRYEPLVPGRCEQHGTDQCQCAH